MMTCYERHLDSGIHQNDGGCVISHNRHSGVGRNPACLI